MGPSTLGCARSAPHLTDGASPMSANGPVSVALARFEDLVARGLRAMIEGDPTLELVAVDVAHDALEAVLRERAPQVALVNFGSLRAAADVRQLARRYPATRLIVLGNRPSPQESSQMLAFGATACLSKETQTRDVLNAIHLASRGLRVLPRMSPDPDASAPVGPEVLTAREAEVLELLQRRQSNAQIAAALHVGVETVRTHARNIYRKLGVRTRRELVPGPTARL